MKDLKIEILKLKDNRFGNYNKIFVFFEGLKNLQKLSYSIKLAIIKLNYSKTKSNHLS